MRWRQRTAEVDHLSHCQRQVNDMFNSMLPLRYCLTGGEGFPGSGYKLVTHRHSAIDRRRQAVDGRQSTEPVAAHIVRALAMDGQRPFIGRWAGWSVTTAGANGKHNVRGCIGEAR